METKSIKSMHVFSFETETTMREMLQYVRVLARSIYKDAIKHGLEITGPVYWVYVGADGQPDTKFTLTIAVPVSKTESEIQNSEFRLKKLEPFECVSQTHIGEWSKLGETYGALFGELHAKNLPLNGQTREIYLNMDFDNPEANITEVQIGIL